MSFADELRGITAQKERDDQAANAAHLKQLEASWPWFCDLFCAYLKGICVENARIRQTSASCRLSDFFWDKFRGGVLLDGNGVSRLPTQTELARLDIIRSAAGENRLPEQYARDLADQIKARFKAEGLCVNALPVEFDGCRGICFDVECTLSW